MSTKSTVQPKITLLDHDQMDQIHRHSLKILSSTGIRVDSEAARQIFISALGEKAISGDRVRIPAETIRWALHVAPSNVKIYDRLGNPAFHLGNDRMRFGIGVTALYYQQPGNDEVVPFSRLHMEKMVRLGHVLPKYDVVSTIGIIQDVPAQVADLYETVEMIANTTKPLVILVSNEDLFSVVLDLLEDLHGDLTTQPFVIPYFNPVTPLVMNVGTADKMLSAIERGLPLIYSNYSMAGMSSPITPASSLALLNAELLAGLTLSQLAKEGAPIILGSLPNYFDMKTMVSFYDPQSILISLACAEMMAFYQLPHCGTSGSANGWGPDLPAVGAYWLNHLTGCLGKAGLAPFIGDTLGAKAFSPATVVHVHEVISQAIRLSQGFVLDEESVALDEIDLVGPGGHFLTAKQTLKHYRNVYFSSPVFPRWTMETWLAQGSPQATQLLREYTLDLLNRLDAPDDHPELIARGEAFIKKQRGR